MAGAADDDDEREKPLDPAVERVRGKLVRFMIINLGLLFLALMAVVVAIVYRAGNRPPPPVAAAPELPLPAQGEVMGGGVTGGDIVLPEGARIAGHALSGSRISLDVLLKDGGRAIYVYDTTTRAMVGRFDIAYKP
jgi:hypothetical protein